MKPPLLLLGVPLLLSTLHAQTITVTATALTPFTPEAGLPPLTATQFQPAGALGPVGVLDPVVTSGAQSSSVLLSWGAASTTTTARFQLGATLDVEALNPSYGDTELCDVVVTFQASSPVSVRLVASSVRQLAVGSSIAQDRVDLDNDGSFEILENGPLSTPLGGTLALGPQPLQVRFRLAFSQTGPGTTSITRILELQPANNLSIQYAFPGCQGGSIESFGVQPTFADSGIELRTFYWSAFAVAVLGLDFQPVQFPTPTPLPCLLIPSTDVLLVMPPNQPVHLPLPPAVRPVAFWAQVVAPLGLTSSLEVSDAFGVLAF